MDLFRRDRVKPAFTTPPTEPPPAAVEALVAEVDDLLREITSVPRAERADGLLWQEDRLLDRRNQIRPARVRETPYVPGGPVR